MGKIGIIIRREYTTRVVKKSFLLMTFLTPLFFAAMIVIPLWLSTIKDTGKREIAVVDVTNEYAQALASNAVYQFIIVQQPAGDIGKSDLKNQFYAIVAISGDLVKDSSAVTVYAEKQIDLELKNYIANQLNRYVENKRLESYQIPNIKQIISSSQAHVKVTTIKLDAKGNEVVTSSEIATVIGGVTTMLIYLFIFLYGVQVMRGVVEEKTNRIIEVIVSSVKPFELMMGKIIGIALVGLTQFLLWVVLTGIISSVAGVAFWGNMSHLQTTAPMNGTEVTQSQQIALNMLSGLQGINFTEIAVYFLIYFLGGYLLYASLFAAIGSAVDNDTDTQQFMMPITLPILFAIYAAIYSIRNPDGPLAFWCSIIPFTSPIVMMVRLPFDVPAWQLVLSITLLIFTFIGTTWLAGKIYRVGILMYGKKPSWRELLKWIRYKN